MRDLGYSLETAVADLLDNSISADATIIQIFCDLTLENPVLAVIDNGKGMSADEVVAAMRYGSSGPAQQRLPGDLGRFGLGLKTASLSQCRCLTVVSTQNNALHSAKWDLNLIDEKDDWLISVLDEDEIRRLPFVEMLGKNGTLILWRDLDRLLEDVTGPKQHEVINEKLDALGKHLSLVFHRYLSGEIRGRKKLAVFVNGHNLEAFDPFCRSNSATQRLPEEIIRIDGVRVKMQPYILPHHSKLSATEYDYYQSRSDFISNQGAYIYRDGRLMAWGDWFRLIPKGENTKLARVQIDFPTRLDESWTIDIKKSRANPPLQVRNRLKQVIGKISDRSTTVHRGRGKKLFDEIRTPVWERYAEQGQIRYSLNRKHPLVVALETNLEDGARNSLNILLEAIVASLPIEMIYSDCSTDLKDVRQSQVTEDEVIDKLEALKDVLFDGKEVNADSFREVINSTRFFEACPDMVEQFIEEKLI
ncbi:MAG: ATP-binding protein [Gammaproteobacteria bacterium]|nr:ATP-binding protein [Gammaproteobacteria bacterium]